MRYIPTREDIGTHRLTVSKFRRVMKPSSLDCLHMEEWIKSILRPMKYIPRLRELFLAEVVGVYRKAD